MPKIKAYSGASKLIPVKAAKVVTAFQCPFTNKVFSKKSRYIEHLKSYREANIHKIIRINRLDQAFATMREAKNLNELVNFIELNSYLFLENIILRDPYKREQALKTSPLEFFIKVEEIALKHSPSVSNSHTCPLNGGVTNWGGHNKNAPTGYPGWQGRITFTVKSPYASFSSELFRHTGVVMGSGGGGGDPYYTDTNHYGYELKLYDADFPNLISELTFSLLSGNRYGSDVLHYSSK